MTNIIDPLNYRGLAKIFLFDVHICPKGAYLQADEIHTFGPSGVSKTAGTIYQYIRSLYSSIEDYEEDKQNYKCIRDLEKHFTGGINK